jgi:hypothetical protein
MNKNEGEVMKRYARAIAAACTAHGSIVGPLVVCQDVMTKAAESSSVDTTRALTADATALLSWVTRTLSESLHGGIKGGK